jgi:hydrogenase nickel incorporation protein HypA/HybF
MHESSLARGILEAVLLRVPAGERVVAVRGWVAETEALDPMALQLNFAGAAQGTAAEGAALRLQVTHVAARCRDCGHTYLPEHHLTLCPACGSPDGDVLGRTGLGIDEVDLRREPA